MVGQLFSANVTLVSKTPICPIVGVFETNITFALTSWPGSKLLQNVRIDWSTNV